MIKNQKTILPVLIVAVLSFTSCAGSAVDVGQKVKTLTTATSDNKSAKQTLPSAPAAAKTASAAAAKPGAGVPQLLLPANKAVANTLTPLLKWKNSTGAVSSTLQVALENTFESCFIDKKVTGVSEYRILPEEELSWSSLYYWRVKEADAKAKESPWSTVLYFQTADSPPPAAPTYLTAARASSIKIELSWWDNSNNEQGFKIERMTAKDKFTQIAAVDLNITSYSDIAVTPGTSYFYRIYAFNRSGNSEFSNQATATTAPGIPDIPVLSLPASGALLTTTLPVLAWNVAKMATNYRLQVAADGTFSNLIVDRINLYDTRYTLEAAEELAWNTTYYWRVMALNNASDTSGWSGVRTFKTGLRP